MQKLGPLFLRMNFHGNIQGDGMTTRFKKGKFGIAQTSLSPTTLTQDHLVNCKVVRTAISRRIAAVCSAWRVCRRLASSWGSTLLMALHAYCKPVAFSVTTRTTPYAPCPSTSLNVYLHQHRGNPSALLAASAWNAQICLNNTCRIQNAAKGG